MIWSAVISSLCSSMNCRNDATVLRARSSASAEGPASMTASALTVSIVCSYNLRMSSSS